MAVETSIVIRTLNEAKHLESLMQGIHNQSYKDWEIVLVDSGSSDGTLEIAERSGARIFHIPSHEFTFGRSLNLGCAEARGKYLVFASGHVWPTTNSWLKNITRPFEERSVAMVYGRQRGTDANRLSELRDLHMIFGPNSHILVDEPRGNNGNSAIRKDLWEDQPFDETLTGLEDVDWARKVEQQGYRVYYAADAPVRHVHEESLRQVYTRYLREAIATKRMFPHYRFTWQEFLRGLPYAILRDVLFAFRYKHIKKLPRVPASRMAHFFGIYRGVRHQTRLAREMASQLRVPETNHGVVSDGSGQHRLESAEPPQVHGDQSLVQVAFANVRNEETSRDQPNSFGREYAGIVVQSGGGLRKGQKVAGIRNRTSNNGNSGSTWSYAEFLAVEPGELQRLPQDTPLKHGALVGMVAACLDGLSSLQMDVQRSALVVGAGPVGNICAQLLDQRGVKVTVVDQNDRWLSLLDKYEVDTLQELGPLDGYDYLIDTGGSPGSVDELLSGCAPTATVVALYVRVAIDDQSRNSRVIYASASPAPKHRHEALRLVSSGLVSLNDHTASVEPLEAYEKAWEGLRSGKQFNVLLCVSRELEDL